MELSEAERELIALLRGRDTPEFTLQISLEKSTPVRAQPEAGDGICSKGRCGPSP